MIDTIIAIGTIVGMLYGLYKFMKEHNIDREQIALYFRVLKSGAGSTFDFIKNLAALLLVSVARVFYSFFVFAWRIYMTVTVPVICIFLYIQNLEQVEKEQYKGFLVDLNSYFQTQYNFLESLPEYGALLFFLAFILLVGWSVEFDNIITALEKRAERYLEELKKLSEEFI